jgi:hypothetical protein
MLRGNMLLLMQADSKVFFLLKNRFFKHQIKEYLDRRGEKMVESQLQTRGGAVWQLVGLITRRS